MLVRIIRQPLYSQNFLQPDFEALYRDGTEITKTKRDKNLPMVVSETVEKETILKDPSAVQIIDLQFISGSTRVINSIITSMEVKKTQHNLNEAKQIQIIVSAISPFLATEKIFENELDEEGEGVYLKTPYAQAYQEVRTRWWIREKKIDPKSDDEDGSLDGEVDSYIEENVENLMKLLKYLKSEKTQSVKEDILKDTHMQADYEKDTVSLKHLVGYKQAELFAFFIFNPESNIQTIVNDIVMRNEGFLNNHISVIRTNLNSYHLAMEIILATSDDRQ